MPQTSVIRLLERVQLAVVRATFRIDLRILVLNEYALHGPLAVNKSAISNHKCWLLPVWALFVACLATRAHNFA